MTTIPELQAKMAKLPTNLDRLDGFVNGPATGTGSTTVTDGGTVPSLMKLVAEFGYGPVLRDLSDVNTVRVFLTTYGGGPIYVEGGVYRPDFMAAAAAGEIFDVPGGTTMIASGTVEIRTNNPSRGIFREVGGGKVTFIGDWRFVGDFDGAGTLARPNISWKHPDDYAATQAWLGLWNAYAQSISLPQIAINQTIDFKTQWNNVYTWSRMQADGQFSSVNRCSGIITENSDYVNTRRTRIYVENMVTGVCAQGKSQTAATYLFNNYGGGPYTAAQIEAAKAAIQTVGVHLGDIDCGPNVFAPFLTKKQRDHRVGWVTGETDGHRIGGAQPHGGGYFSNEESDYEETWGAHVDGINLKNYDGGSVFKSKGVKGLTWGVMYLDSIHAALSITLGTTGTGGDVIVRNQRVTTDSVNGAGGNYCINITKSPGFVLGGQVVIEQAAAQNAMKLISVEYSPGFKMPQGLRFKGARTTNIPMCRIVSSDNCRIGLTDYEDTGANGGPIWSVGDGDLGGSNNCVFEGFRTKGTAQLVEVKGSSSGTVVSVRPADVENFNSATALLDSGLGGNNILDIQGAGLTAMTEAVAYAATDILQTAATASLALDLFTVAVGSDDDIGKPKNPLVGGTFSINSRAYTFRLAADLTVADRILTEDAGVDTGNANQTLKNASQAINDNGVEGIAGKYGTSTTINADVTADQTGPYLNVRAKTRGTAGNSITLAVGGGLLGSWSSSTLTGGGVYDAELMNRWRSYDTTSGSTDVSLPPLASTPVNAWVGFFKRVAANLLVIKDSTGATLFTLAAAGDAICLRRNTDGTAWSIVSVAPAWLATTFNQSAGFIARTAAGSAASRTLTAPAAGLTISNPTGAGGNPSFALANDLAGVEGITGTGFARRTATDTWSASALVAADIPAKTLIPSHFKIVDNSNIILNPIFSLDPHSAGSMDGWDGTSASAVSGDIAVTTTLPATAPTPFVCSKSVLTTANDLTAGNSQFFAAGVGDVFYYEYWACSTADCNGTLSFGLRSTAVGGAVSTGPAQSPISPTVGTWTKYSGLLTVSLANTYGVRPYFRGGLNASPLGSWFITGVRVFRATLTAQISDATLQALAGLTYSSGSMVPVMTAQDVLAMRTIGVAASTDLPDRAAADTRYAQLGAANTFTGVNTISGSNAAVVRIMDSTPNNAAPWLEVVGDRNDGNVSGAFGGQLALARVRTDAEHATGSVLGRLLLGGSVTPNDYASANLRYSGSIVGYADGAWPVGGATTPTGLRFYVGDTPQTPNAANVTVGNILALQLDKTGAAIFVAPVQVPAGSASAPGLSVGGTNSGLFLASSDVVVARGGVEKFRVGAALLSFSNASGNAVFSAVTDGANTAGFNATRYSADNQGAQNILRKARGSLGTPSSPSSGDRLGQIDFQFSTTANPTTWRDSGQIRSTVVAATPSDTDAEGRLALFASAAGSVTLTEMLGIQHSTGLQMFGANTVINAARHPVLRSYTVATLPTAGPAGQLIYVSDGTSNKRLAVSDATNWRWPDGAIVS